MNVEQAVGRAGAVTNPDDDAMVEREEVHLA
jgi:hypothetical protein